MTQEVRELEDAILAILSFAVYSGMDMENYYKTPAEGYTAEGLEEFLDVVGQILTLEVVKGITIKGLIEVAEQAAEPIRAVMARVRRRPPMVLTDD